MSGPQHKWVCVVEKSPSLIVGKWRCKRCGHEVWAKWKPTPRYLRIALGVSRDCAEQLAKDIIGS